MAEGAAAASAHCIPAHGSSASWRDSASAAAAASPSPNSMQMPSTAHRNSGSAMVCGQCESRRAPAIPLTSCAVRATSKPAMPDRPARQEIQSRAEAIIGFEADKCSAPTVENLRCAGTDRWACAGSLTARRWWVAVTALRCFCAARHSPG